MVLDTRQVLETRKKLIIIAHRKNLAIGGLIYNKKARNDAIKEL
jgi:hypothetical protein